MAAIILLHADDAKCTEIISDDYGCNLVFNSAEDADSWLCKNARVGWCTRIIDLDD